MNYGSNESLITGLSENVYVAYVLNTSTLRKYVPKLENSPKKTVLCRQSVKNRGKLSKIQEVVVRIFKLAHFMEKLRTYIH